MSKCWRRIIVRISNLDIDCTPGLVAADVDRSVYFDVRRDPDLYTLLIDRAASHDDLAKVERRQSFNYPAINGALARGQIGVNIVPCELRPSGLDTFYIPGGRDLLFDEEVVFVEAIAFKSLLNLLRSRVVGQLDRRFT